MSLFPPLVKFKNENLKKKETKKLFQTKNLFHKDIK